MRTQLFLDVTFKAVMREQTLPARVREDVRYVYGRGTMAIDLGHRTAAERELERLKRYETALREQAPRRPEQPAAGSTGGPLIGQDRKFWPRRAGHSLFDWRELWPYTAVTFQTTRAGYEIEMYIEPGYEVVRLRLCVAPGGAELLDLGLRGVRSVGVERIHGRELLRLDFPDDSPASTLWLRMKPDVAVLWSYDLMS